MSVRIGVIGAGFIGRVHMRTFAALAGAEVTACADASAELAGAAATELGIPHVFADASELINSRHVDAVVIAVPNLFHAPLTVEALTAGKHVLCEKPMALNGTAAREIVAAERKSGMTAMVAHQMRWLAAPQEAKRVAQGGELGEIYNATCGMMRRKNIPGWGSWFTRMDESGGGPLIDIGVHVLDLAIWLMGNPRPVSVYGSTYAKFGPQKRGLGNWGTPQWDGIFDVEDLATAMIKMDNGATLTLEVSWAVNTKSDNRHWVDLMGTEGGVSIRGDELTLTTQKFDRPIAVESVPVSPVGERDQLAAHFVESISTGTRPVSDVESGLVNNTILDAIYQSAAEGRSIDLDWAALDD